MNQLISLFGVSVAAVTWAEALERVSGWAAKGESKAVVFMNVHSLMTGEKDPGYRQVLAEADFVLADGAPIAWLMRFKGCRGQQRINGPDFMWRYLALAERRLEPVFLLGGTETTLAALEVRLKQAFPRLPLVGAVSPPFRALDAAESEDLLRTIEASGARTVWVSLGCPKQERWIHAHQGRLSAVMLGVGAAFNYHAGTLRRAPLWMQRSGLEWAYRLLHEPRHLWRRYLSTHSRFLFALIRSAMEPLFRA